MSNNSLFAIFNNNQLTTVTGLSILMTDPYKQPKRKLAIASLARSNKARVNSAFYNQKNITIRVGISRSTRDALEQSLDSLNSILQGIEKELWLSQSGGVRKYYCTLSDVVVNKSGGAYWEGDLVFTCSDNFGYDTGYTTIVNISGVTSSTRTDQYSFGGSADFQAPIITIKLTAVTGATNANMVIGNAATGQNLTINRTWAANDFVEIDCQNETVKVNGVEVAFSGAFPKFAVGLGNLTYADNFTTRTFNYFAFYYKRYV